MQLVLFRKTAAQTSPTPTFARASVGISLAAWFSVAMAGRMIGFYRRRSEDGQLEIERRAHARLGLRKARHAAVMLDRSRG